MIKLKDILNESEYESEYEMRYQKKYSKDSKKGNWKLLVFDEGDEKTYSDLTFKITENFKSKVNSHPRMKKLVQNVGEIGDIRATAFMDTERLFSTEYKKRSRKVDTIDFYITIDSGIRLPMGGGTKLHQVVLISDNPFSSWEIQKKMFDWERTDQYIPSYYNADLREIAKFLFKELDAELQARDFHTIEK